jgi:hypothetical protein
MIVKNTETQRAQRVGGGESVHYSTQFMRL